MSDGRNHLIFEVSGKVYNLRVSYNALSEYNKIASLDDLKNKPLPAYRALVWASINAYGNKSITIEQAGDICEDFILEKGMVAFQKTMEQIVKAGTWLNKDGGTDTGNAEAIPVVSPNL